MKFEVNMYHVGEYFIMFLMLGGIAAGWISLIWLTVKFLFGR